MHVYYKYKLKENKKLFFYFKFHLFLLFNKKLVNNFVNCSVMIRIYSYYIYQFYSNYL